MTTNNKRNGNGTSYSVTEGHGVAIGVGIAALAAAAAGAYYLYGSDKGPARRQKIKSWTLRMKAEVMEEIEKLKEVNKEAYETVIATISKKYSQFKDLDPEEVAALAARMKTHWKDIQKDINTATVTRSGAKRKGSPTKKRVATKSK